jgi:hypothetical protein
MQEEREASENNKGGEDVDTLNLTSMSVINPETEKSCCIDGDMIWIDHQ